MLLSLTSNGKESMKEVANSKDIIPICNFSSVKAAFINNSLSAFIYIVYLDCIIQFPAYSSSGQYVYL